MHRSLYVASGTPACWHTRAVRGDRSARSNLRACPLRPAQPTSAAGPTGPAAADPLRQARPAALHQPPGLQPGLRARRVPGPDPDGLLLGLQPPPPDLVRRRGADRVRERGGVPRDRPGRGRGPGAGSPRSWTRRCPTGWTCVEVVESPGGSLADLLQASRWQVDVAAAARRRAPAAVEAFLATESVPVQRMTKKGLREFDCRAAVVSLSAEEAPGGTRLLVGLRHTVPAVRPDDVLTGLRARRRPRDRRGPTAHPAGPGSARRGDRRRTRRPAGD